MSACIFQPKEILNSPPSGPSKFRQDHERSVDANCNFLKLKNRGLLRLLHDNLEIVKKNFLKLMKLLKLKIYDWNNSFNIKKCKITVKLFTNGNIVNLNIDNPLSSNSNFQIIKKFKYFNLLPITFWSSNLKQELHQLLN